MEKSESIKNLALALIKFNTLVGKVKKDSNNPFFKSKYAALPDILDAIEKPLSESGLTINQFPEGDHGLTTILIHAESGEYMMATYTMTPTKNDPQGIGSCITYQRRYAIGAVLSLNIDEDDDGNKASTPNEASQDNSVAQSDNRPWLSDKAFEDAKTRMAAGEKELYTKIDAAYRIKKEFRTKLKELA